MEILSKSIADYKVAILMTTYNAEIYLEEQLQSIVEQSHKKWILCVSDDGSKDNTLDILLSFRKLYGEERVHLFSGPKNGFAQNFLSLICNQEIQADFFAYCDQDDIWDQNKLEVALNALCNEEKNIPSVYGARTKLVDKDNRFLGYSSLFTKKPSISNALVQSMAGGNTMVINNSTRQLLLRCGIVPVISHDWWTYLVVAACDGVMIYDEIPHIRYRQHSQNLVGSNSGINKKITRLRQLLNGEFSKWIDQNLKALESLNDIIAVDKIKIIDDFKIARKSCFFVRLLAMYKTGVYRQNYLGNIGIFIGFILRKI